ncbi:MAG: NUDIX hydrolase [Myxococcota bacterium]
MTPDDSKLNAYEEEDAAFDTLSSDLVSTNPYWEHRHDRYRLRGKQQQPVRDYFYVRTPGSVLVVPRLDDGRLVLVRQLRYLGRRWCLEFPGGGLPAGMEPLEAAKRELIEETGWRAHRWQPLGMFNPCKGLIDETCTVFLADDLEAGTPMPEEAEVLAPVVLSETEVVEAIADGRLWDGMSLAAWALLKRAPDR